MVWIFHFAVFLGISLEEPDIFSVILFIVESVVFTVHLYIEWNVEKADRNKKMRRWVIVFVSMLGVLIFFRYAAFFTRYYIGQSALFSILDSVGLVDSNTKVTDLFNQNTRYYRFFSKANSSNKIYMLFVEFFVQLFYLGLASLTLISLRSQQQEDHDDDSDSSLSSDSGERANSIMPTPKLTGLSGLDEFIRKSVESAQKAFSKLPEDLLSNSGFVIFFVFLVLQRAVTFTVIVYLCTSSSSVMDYAYIFIELGFFILLFHNLAGEFNAFGLEQFNEKNIELFGGTFCKQLITFDPMNEQDLRTENEGFEEVADRYSRVTVKDMEQNCFYINTLLARLQVEITGLTTVVSFIKMAIVAVKTCGAIYQILMYMLYDHQMPSNIKATMTNNTILNTLILIELLSVKDYRVYPSSYCDKVLSQEGISHFCTMIQAKLDYYRSFVWQSLWEVNRKKHIKKITKDRPGNLLRVQTTLIEEDDENDQLAEDRLSNGSRERNKTVKLNLRNMGTTSSISQHFAKFRASSADPEVAKKLFMANITKATKIKIEPSEILVREKKEKFDEIITLYKSFKFSEDRFNKNYQYDFFQTYGEYNFEDPEVFFAKNANHNDEFGEEMEDEFDLGLNTYEKQVLFAIGIGTPRFLKILLMHTNKTKYNYCNALKGCQYFLRRLLLIPVLYIVCIEPNVINLPILLIGIYYAFQSQRTILIDIRTFMPIYSLAFFALYIWNAVLTSSTTLSRFKDNPLFRPVPSECSHFLPSNHDILDFHRDSLDLICASFGFGHLCCHPTVRS